MYLKGDNYVCERCGGVWGFFPEDYDFNEEDYPTDCSFCNMPLWEMVRDIYKEEGVLAVIKQIIKKYLWLGKY